MMSEAKSIALYCTEGSSDKVYQVSLQARGAGWVVEFAYGKRGAALKTGTKTDSPTSYEAALKIYDKLVKEKTGKGYTPDQSGVAYTSTELASQASGFAPQLSTPIDDEELQPMLLDQRYGLQEKRDGENRTLVVDPDSVRGINRKGLYVDIPQAWADAYITLGPVEGKTIICGEACGERFYAFDLIECCGEDLRTLGYEERYLRLMNLVQNAVPLPGLEVIPMHVNPFGKAVHFEKLRGLHREGVVFKRLDAPFEPGKNDNSRKYKFVESVTCLVLRRNAQRSVAVGLLDDDGVLVDLGNVTIPANHEVPEADALVEIQFLYRYEDGAFEQPVYRGQRTDLDREEARLSQIKRIKRKSADLAA
jgi:bifunctional non-homologous end joining protein LigD